MIWILAFLCLGFAALVGYAQGPIRGIFALAGLFFASILAGPVGSLVKPLVLAFGFKHPIYTHSIPAAVGFVIIWAIFVAAGAAVHKKTMFSHKYGDDDARFYRWERVYQRLGVCLGLFCGATFFFVLLLPVYVAGYFTTQFLPGSDGPTSVRIVNSIRNDMHTLKLDRVLAAFDPLPAPVYEASDLAATLLGNRTLVTRIAKYPLFLSLAERPEYHDLATDPDFVRLYNSQATPVELLKNPKLNAIASNPILCGELFQLLGDNLADFKEFLTTGKSPKYDGEKLLGCWTINPNATFSQERKKVSNCTATQLLRLRANLVPLVGGLNLTITTDNQAILRRGETISTATVVARGSWKKNGSTYQLSFPNAKPETADVAMADGQITFTSDNVTMVFDREP